MIYIYQDSVGGSYGLIMNKPFGSAGGDILGLNITGSKAHISNVGRLFLGGPVAISKVSVVDPIHSEQKQYIGCSSTKSVVEKYFFEKAEESIFLLGTVEWAAGVLYNEIKKNYWHVVDASPDIVFSGEYTTMYDRAIEGVSRVSDLGLIAAQQVIV